ncbi:hypothetical protein ACHZ97_02560 [Lysobacter soli]|uniref:hypothetical protein n=1 Tax=Lysobacter soli TaxID=453783 RepID=UPI0037C65280
MVATQLTRTMKRVFSALADLEPSSVALFIRVSRLKESGLGSGRWNRHASTLDRYERGLPLTRCTLSGAVPPFACVTLSRSSDASGACIPAVAGMTAL